MNLKAQNLLILIGILWIILACGSETKTIETVSGRLKYVQTLQHGTVGTHGSKGWYGVNKQFYVNDRAWLLKEDFDGCHASPNESVEAFNCYKFQDLREMTFVVRIKEDKLDWLKIYDDDSIKSSGKNLGQWVSEAEGKWLIFEDFFYQVETSERREIKGLPDYPQNHYRAASPDLETVVYEGGCYDGYPDAPIDLKLKKEKHCQETEKLSARKLIPFWLIDVKTGETRFIQLSREKYDWLGWDRAKFESRYQWLKLFQKQFIWVKDKEGKFQLVSSASDEAEKKK